MAIETFDVNAIPKTVRDPRSVPETEKAIFD